MKHPEVSIIIPTYNREKLILKSINSVLNQTFQDFELLIIDDGSTDQTKQVIEDLKNPKIKYHALEKNSGQCIARNVGIKQASGTYVAFLDSDDTWMPEKLEKQVECFRNGSERLGGVYCYSIQENVISNSTILKGGDYFRGDIHDEFLRGFCPPTPSLFLVKKSALESVNGLDEDLITFVDLDLWIRLSEKHDFDYIEEPLIVKYEQIGDQYVNNFEKRYAGYFLFMSKWESEVKKSLGRKGLLKLKQTLVGALAVPLLEYPPVGFQKNIPKLIGLILKVRSVRLRLYVKAIRILIFGTGNVSKG